MQCYSHSNQYVRIHPVTLSPTKDGMSTMLYYAKLQGRNDIRSLMICIIVTNSHALYTEFGQFMWLPVHVVMSSPLSVSSPLSTSIQMISKESSVSLAHMLWGVTGIAGLVSVSEPPFPMESLAMDSFSTSSYVSMAALSTH